MNSRLPLPLLFLLASVIAAVCPTAAPVLPPPLPPPLVERFDGNPQNVGLWEAAPLGSGPTVEVAGGG